MIDPVHDALIRIEVKQKNLSNDVAEIKDKVNDLPCKINTHRLKLLERIVFSAIAIILVIVWTNLFNIETKPAKANISTHKINMP
jgi:hypothetical protein